MTYDLCVYTIPQVQCTWTNGSNRFGSWSLCAVRANLDESCVSQKTYLDVGLQASVRIEQKIGGLDQIVGRWNAIGQQGVTGLVQHLTGLTCLRSLSLE